LIRIELLHQREGDRICLCVCLVGTKRQCVKCDPVRDPRDGKAGCEPDAGAEQRPLDGSSVELEQRHRRLDGDKPAHVDQN
jgi:hypothetical protein